MKFLILVTILCALSMIGAVHVKHHSKAKLKSKSWYNIKIDWLYNSTTGVLGFDTYDADSAYADYITAS